MTTPCVLTLEGVDIPVWEAEFTQVVINAGGGGGGGGGPVAWGAIIGTLANQTDLALALAAKASIASLATVATSGAYADLSGRPVLGTAAASNIGDFAPASHTHAAASISDSTPTGRALLTAVDAAAARAVIGTTQSAWGNITGTLSAQVDLSAALAGKLSAASNLGDLPNTVAARINLGLGALAVKNTVAVADVSASGTPGASTFLRGDGTWAVPPSGSGGGAAAWGGITGTLGDQADLAAALNAKANTASLAAVATAGTYASLTGKPTLGTAAASNVGDFATATQGAKADSAVQPADLAPYAKTADLPAVPTKTSQLTNDSGFVTASTPVIASEPLTAGDWVSLWDSGGDARVRKSDHASLDKEVDGYVLVGVASGAVAEVFTSGMNTAVVGQQLGPVFAAAAGAGAASAGAGAAFAQRIGTAVRPDAVVFSRGTAVGL